MVRISCFLPTGFKNSKSFVTLVKNWTVFAYEVDWALTVDAYKSRQSAGFFSEGKMSK